MQRTNVYLEERQLATLRAFARSRGDTVAGLVRAAVDRWLAEQGVEAVDEDEWGRRFDRLLDRGRSRAAEQGLTAAAVDDQVGLAIREVRAARRR